MLRKLLMVGVVAGSSASIPILYQANPEAFHNALRSAMQGDEAPKKKLASPVVQVVRPSQDVLPGRKVRLTAGEGGHFIADFKLNGRVVTAMIDTGATVVAINQTTARRIGIKLKPADFRSAVMTANGRAPAANIVIDRLEIGRIAVKDVDALVLDDRALGGTLIGMSFLKQLSKFEAREGTLTLMQ